MNEPASTLPPKVEKKQVNPNKKVNELTRKVIALEEKLDKVIGALGLPKSVVG